jgi:hypothetical protein
MNAHEAITDIAEGATDLHPLLDRIKLSITRLNDDRLSRDFDELIALNARMFNATSALMRIAEAELAKKEVIMDPAFAVHMLTDEGKVKAEAIAQSFDRLLTELRSLVPIGRELALTVTKLEEAAFFAKKGIVKANSQ